MKENDLNIEIYITSLIF